MRKTLLAVLIVSFALVCFGQDDAQSTEEAMPTGAMMLIAQADSAHDANDFTLTMELLMQALELDQQNPEIYWKISRGFFDFADQKPNDPVWKKQYVYDGRDYAEKALELDETSAGGHKWYAINHGQIGEIEGTEQKIKNSYGMRDHTLLAIKYDPDDAGNYHVMGRWHYALADLSWIERQIASLIYATPPEASFEEALEYFKKAHELDKEDIRNMLYIGLCYDQLDDEKMAAEWLKQAINAKAVTESDMGLQQEAKEALDDL